MRLGLSEARVGFVLFQASADASHTAITILCRRSRDIRGLYAEPLNHVVQQVTENWHVQPQWGTCPGAGYSDA